MQWNIIKKPYLYAPNIVTTIIYLTKFTLFEMFLFD